MGRQKVVTTFEADAKSSGHLLTRSHEGAGPVYCRGSFLLCLSPLRNLALFDRPIVLNSARYL